MASQEDTTPIPPTEEVETDAVAYVLGKDPWMRFDLWANRAWESTSGALNIVLNGDPDSVDGRAMALFHAAQIAKEFSLMVNPLSAVANGGGTVTTSADSEARAILAMIMEEDD